jgi:hypothetical protein
MSKYKKIKFIIDGFTPMTIPIGRLSEYLRNFASLVGPNSNVHFVRVGKGSLALESLEAEEEAVLPVGERIKAAQSGVAALEANRGVSALRELLHADNTTGRIKEGRRKIIEFPKPKASLFCPVTEECTLEGILIKIGGRDETIPVHLQDGENYYKCNATRAKAKELAKYLFGAPIRLFGRGRWNRTDLGQWKLENFQISDYEELNDDEIQRVFEKMRLVPGSGWDAITDPLTELDRIRNGDEKVN